MYGRSLKFWHALVALLQRKNGNLSLEGPHMETLKQAMILSLSSPSHEMRVAVIYILQIILDKRENLRNVVSIAMMIEQASLDLGNQRNIAMRIGQLANLFPEVCSNEWIAAAIPAFCFGLLHVRLASIWDDTCLALKAMSVTDEGEALINQISLQWLHIDTIQRNVSIQTETVSSRPRHMSEFQCTNLIALQDCFTNIQTRSEDWKNQLKVAFNEQHVTVPPHNSFCRTQALRLLNTLTNSAQKLDNLFVPIILEWTHYCSERLEDHIDLLEDIPNSSRHWTMAEKKALLSLLEKITNPQALHRATELREALLVLLCHGDVEIQRAALKTLLAWRTPGIIPYQEQLLNLLDDARFGDELPFFLTPGGIRDEEFSQMLPIILRLFYGKVIAGKQGCESRRKTVFVGIQNVFGNTGISQFLDIALGPLKDISVLSNSALDEGVLNRTLMDTRKQVAILNLLDNLLSTFRTSFSPFTSKIVDPLLYCAIKATRELSKANNSECETETGASPKTSLLKTIRQRALQILGRLFESCPEFSWQPYMSSIVKELIEPRLGKLPIETAQSVSSLLRLFAAWSKSLLTSTFLIDYNQDILVKITECLRVKSAKDEVKCFVLDEIIWKIISLGAGNEESIGTDTTVLQHRIRTKILERYSNTILSAIEDVVRRSPCKELLESSIQTIADLAPYVMGSTESQNMIEIATFLLRQPAKRVTYRTKQGLLRMIQISFSVATAKAWTRSSKISTKQFALYLPLFKIARQEV